MKSFKEYTINEENYDLSSFNNLLKAKQPNIESIPADSYYIDLSTFNTIIKQKNEIQEIIQIPEQKIIEKIIEKETVIEKEVEYKILDGKDGVDGEKGNDGKTPTIKINEIKIGKTALVENVGTDTELLLNFVLPEGVEGKRGQRGLKGDGIKGEDGKAGTIKLGKVELGESLEIKNVGNSYDAVLDFVIPKPINGITPTVTIASVIEGDTAEIKNIGTDTDLILEFTIPKARHGNDGYTPIKGADYFDGKDGYIPLKDKDYFDGKDGYTPIKGVDYFDGKTPKISLGKIKEGDTFNIEQYENEDETLLDFTVPKIEKYEPPKDGYTPIKGVDYFDGKDGNDGYTPIKGVDYFDGEDGLPPEHEFSDTGNIRFRNPDGSWGNWIDNYGMITRLLKHFQQRGDASFGGGGSNLDFIVDSGVYQNIKYLNIDTESLLASFNGEIMTIGINPNYVGKGAGRRYTYDYYKLQSDNVRTFILSKPLVLNSEIVIMNGTVLTFGVDYDVINNTIVIDNKYNTLQNWNITIKYAYDETLMLNGINNWGIDTMPNIFTVS